MKHKITILIALFLVTGGLRALRAQQPRSSLEEEVWQTDLESARVFAERNPDLSMGFFDPEVVMLAPGSERMSGINAVRELYESFFADPNLAGAWEPVLVRVAGSGDVAYTVGEYELQITGSNGKPIIDRGKYVSIWRKQQDGRWKVIVDMFNSTAQKAAE